MLSLILMSLEDIKEKLESRKRAFECELKNTYGVENQNDMTRIHDNEVNKIAECNLLHDIISPHKRTKNLNSRYSLIIHGCMNTEKVEQILRTFKYYWKVDVSPRL